MLTAFTFLTSIATLAQLFVPDLSLLLSIFLPHFSIALSLFRKLGWTPSLTPGSNPNHSQMPFDAILARSDQRSGLLSINVTEQYMKEMGLSEFAVADQLWKAVE